MAEGALGIDERIDEKRKRFQWHKERKFKTKKTALVLDAA